MLRTLLVRTAGVLGAWSITRRLTRHVPRIFMLHRFAAEPTEHATGAVDFARFVDRLASEFDLLTVRDLVRQLNYGTPSRPMAAITVDDGYADFYDFALPILASRGVPATIYVTAGFVARSCWLWWDAVRYLFSFQPDGPLEIELPGRRFRFVLDGLASRDHARSEIAEYLVTRNEDRSVALSLLQESAKILLPASPPPEYAAMGWKQLRACEAAGIEVGGHTMTHAFLPALGPDALVIELQQAKDLLESKLHGPVTTFAYPNGMPYDWTPELADAVQAAGFEAAVLAHPRPFSSDQRYRLGRWSASVDDPHLDHILSGASALKLALKGPEHE